MTTPFYLQKLTLTKIMNQGIKRAIRERLVIVLTEEVNQKKYWEDHVRFKLNATRQKQVEREFNKRIQALKIVVYILTPFFERTEDVPTTVIKKKKP